MYLMRKLSVILIMLLLAVASCTKKSAPTTNANVTVIKPVGPAVDAHPIFAQNCARCHGENGANGKAPNIATGELTRNEIVDKVTNGAGHMPAFANKLSAQEIDAVAEFVLHLKK
jgi:mono/diheme cytochrome c family protein